MATFLPPFLSSGGQPGPEDLLGTARGHVQQASRTGWSRTRVRSMMTTSVFVAPPGGSDAPAAGPEPRFPASTPAGSAGGRSAARATPGRWATTPPPSARAPDAEPLPARYFLSPAGPAERVLEADWHVALDHRPPWGRHWPTAISPRVSRPRKIVRSGQQTELNNFIEIRALQDVYRMPAAVASLSRPAFISPAVMDAYPSKKVAGSGGAHS